jgi:hypothetical protein
MVFVYGLPSGTKGIVVAGSEAATPAQYHPSAASAPALSSSPTSTNAASASANRSFKRAARPKARHLDAWK